MWVTDPANWTRTPTLVPFSIVEDERPDQRAKILDDLVYYRGAIEGGEAVAVISNGHFDTTKTDAQNQAAYRPIIDAGLSYIGEVYGRTDAGEPTGFTLADMQYLAINKLGWPVGKIQPAYGRFGGASYPDAAAPFADWPIEGVITNA